MSKGKIFALCDGEETIEVYFISNMPEDEVIDKWYDYYWSSSYRDYKEFLKKIKQKGYSAIEITEKEASDNFIKVLVN